MPYNPNDPNYQTKNSRVLNFNDFEENIGKEKEELKKVNRSFKKPDSENQTPGNTKFKYNKVTHKIDTLSKAEVEDDIDAIEVKDKGHKYKIVEDLDFGDKPDNYMFFSNLETIKRLSEMLLNMDKDKIDQVLNEHDWASDHIATSKDDIEEVFNFFAGNPTKSGASIKGEERELSINPITKNIQF